MDDEQLGRLRILLAGGLVLLVVGGTVDLVLDRPTTWRSFHVLFELGLVALGVVLATALGMGWLRAERSAGALREDLERREAEAEAWQARARGAMEGFGHLVREQFDAWELTEAEREVALHLLRGHSHKAIARATRRSSQTIRQHASSVYAKSGLAGRAELSAWFLAGLAIPGQEEGGG